MISKNVVRLSSNCFIQVSLAVEAVPGLAQ